MYQRPRILGNLKKRPNPNPIIEIVGPPDIGKTQLAIMLAKRLDAIYFPFPVLDIESSTGQLLLTSLTTKMDLLEQVPQWWAHIYIASVFEQKEKLLLLREKAPIIVTNYLASFRTFSRSIEATTSLAGFTYGLPEPNYVFHIFGSEWTDRPTNLMLNYSLPFRQKLRRSFLNGTIPKAKKIRLDNNMNRTERFNLAIAEMSAIVAKKFKLKENFEQTLYKRGELD